MDKQSNSNSEFIKVLNSYSNAIDLLQRRTNISSGTLLYKLGELFGNALSHDISSTKLNEVLKETFLIWQKEGLGKGSIVQQDPLTITIKDCHGCDQIPYKNDVLDCSFREGMMTAIIDNKIKSKSEVKHISSYGKLVGKKRCWFVVMETDKNKQRLKNKSS